MFYEDFSNYSYIIGREITYIKNIGWITNFIPIPNKQSLEINKQEVLDKLKQLIANKPVNVMRGCETCKICNDFQHVFIFINGKKYLLGHYEIWIPSIYNEEIFASPTLIYHYIEKHNYIPPKVYIDSLMAFDEYCNWDGNEILEKLRNKME